MQNTDFSWAKEPILSKLHNTIGPNNDIEDTISLHLQFGVTKLTKEAFIEILGKLNAGITNDDARKFAGQLADSETERIDIKMFYKCYNKLFPKEENCAEIMERIRKAVARGFFNVYEVFEEHSVNKDLLTFSQFELGLEKINAGLAQEQIKALFDQNDKTKAGTISCEQFATNLEEYSLANSPITQDNPNLPTIKQIRLYIKNHPMNTMAILFRNLIKQNLEGKYWITKKDFKDVLSDMGINIEPVKFESFVEYLDTGRDGQIDYDYFCQVLGYIQPLHETLEAKFSAIPTESQIVDQSLKRIIEEIATSVEKGKHNLQEIFKEKDDSNSGRISKIKFIEIIRTIRESLDYNNIEITALCNHFEDPTTHNIQYNGFLSQVNQVLNKSKEEPVRINLQWADKILDEICIYLYYKQQTSYEYFKAYELNPDNKSVPLESFEEGIKAMQIEMSEKDLNRLKRDLDTDGDKTISAEEFSRHLDERKEKALERYKTEVTTKVRDYIKTKSINFKPIMQKHDEYKTKRISSNDFKNELRNEFRALLTEQQYNYLVRKYEVESGKVAYMDFINSMSEKEVEVNVDEEQMLVDRLRENIRSLNIKAVTYLKSMNSVDKTYNISALSEIFPRSILSTEEYSTLAKLIDKTEHNKFTLDNFCELFWTNEVEENERTNTNTKKLNRNIEIFCKNKNINLKELLEQLDKDNTGYISVNSIKDLFFKVGLKFSFKQLSCLLYYQGIRSDERYFKNYGELLEKINDDNDSMDGVIADAMKVTGPIVAEEDKKVTLKPDAIENEAKASIHSEKESVGGRSDTVVKESRLKKLEDEQEEKQKEEPMEDQKEIENFPAPKEIALDDDILKYLTEQLTLLRKFLQDNKVDVRGEFSKHEINGYIDFDKFCRVLHTHKVDLEDQDVLNAFYSYLKEDQEGKISAKRLYDALLRGKVLTQYNEGKEVIDINKSMGIKRLAEFMDENDIPLSSLKKFMLVGGSIRKEHLSKTLTGINYPFTQAELNIMFKSISIRDNVIGSVGHLLTLVNEEYAKKNPKILELTSESRETLTELNKEIEEKKLTQANIEKMLNYNGDGYIHSIDFTSIFAQANFKTLADKLNKLFSNLDIYNVTALSTEFLLKQIIGIESIEREQVNYLPIDMQISTEAETLFTELDKQNNGSLTEEEFYKAVVASSHNRCTREEIKELMRRLDVSQSGTISKEEFRKYMETRIKNDIMTAEDEMVDLKAELKEYDFDGNGYLASHELYIVLSKECPALQKSDLDEIFSELDPNKEGKIDISEFIDYIRNPIRQAQLDKNTGKYRVILMLKHQRRLNPIDYFNSFETLSNSMLYNPSFISKLHTMEKNLPSESFKVIRNASGLGYVDIEPTINTENKPINVLKEIIPGISGYIIFNNATGVPIPDPLILKRENIVNRVIKVVFYDNKNTQYLYGSATVQAGWNAGEEHAWTFNSTGNVGTNPLVFKWGNMSILKQIDVVFEFISSIRSGVRVLEVTNGWTKIPLERLNEGRTHTLEIYAGTPIRSSILDETDIRINRKGLFSCGRIRSLLTIKCRPFSNLLAIKQVLFIIECRNI